MTGNGADARKIMRNLNDQFLALSGLSPRTKKLCFAFEIQYYWLIASWNDHALWIHPCRKEIYNVHCFIFFRYQVDNLNLKIPALFVKYKSEVDIDMGLNTSPWFLKMV